MDNKNRILSCDIATQTSFKIIPTNSSYRNPIPNEKSSHTSLLAKFCKKCLPESIRIDQDKSQEIDIDVLYAYDPFQREVG